METDYSLNGLGHEELAERMAELGEIDSLALSSFWGAELRVESSSTQVVLDFIRLHLEDSEDGLVQEMDLVSTAEWFLAHGAKISFGVNEAVRWPFRVASYLSLWHLKWQWRCRKAA